MVWVLVAWAALRWPNGAAPFLMVLQAFLLLHLLLPALRRVWRLPVHQQSPPALGPQAAAPATALLLLAGLCGIAPANTALAGGIDQLPGQTKDTPQITAPARASVETQRSGAKNCPSPIRWRRKSASKINSFAPC